MILAAASIVNPGYVPESYQVFLLTTLIMVLHGAISSSKQLSESLIIPFQPVSRGPYPPLPCRGSPSSWNTA